MKTADIIAVLIASFLVVVFVVVIVAAPVMFLWNWLIPDITNGLLKPIDFWQALGLSFLCRLLFTHSSSPSVKTEK